MKKVAFLISPVVGEFHGFRLDYLDPFPYFVNDWRGSLRDVILNGFDGYDRRRLLFSAEGVDELYRSRHTAYMRFITDFIDRYADYDVVVLGTYNPIHPEVLHNELRKPIKILGFVDDPLSTYRWGVASLWAFDGAFYISPSYDERTLMRDALANWGCRQSYWLPLTSPANVSADVDESFFAARTRRLIYVGKSYGSKVDRLRELKIRFGDRFEVYGRWPLFGYSGLLRALNGGKPFWHRVRSLSDSERRERYLQTQIGFNMHISGRPMETGNMRMYETTLHGMMLLCDKGGRNAHATIFEPDREAVFYDSLPDAIDKAEYYLAHPNECIDIAWNGFRRAHRDYNWERNFTAFLTWASSLKRHGARQLRAERS